MKEDTAYETIRNPIYMDYHPCYDIDCLADANDRNTQFLIAFYHAINYNVKYKYQ